MQAQTLNNPFSINRAEHLGKDLYRYFSGANIFSGLLSQKSLVLQGGRGSGKTMYFMYHSYESKKREHQDASHERSLILEKERILGVYYKAEPDLVTGFKWKDRDGDWWLRVFGHHFNTTVCRAICHIAADLKNSQLTAFQDETKICSVIAKNFGLNNMDINTFEKLEDELKVAEDQVLLYINNIDKMPEPTLSHHSHAMRRLAEMIINSVGFDGLAFHVFIDEFENLEEYQQKLINSLIKNPDMYLVFDIGVRKKGFKTSNTLAVNEQISPYNDYLPFDLEEEISPSKYDELIREICRKRLSTVPELMDCKDDETWLRIDHYLGSYELEKEVEMIISKKPMKPYVEELNVRLSKIRDEDSRRRLLDVLTSDSNPLYSRLNLALLSQRKSPEQISEEFTKFQNGLESKYKQWLHNYGLGVVFLLCGDYGQRKRYFGYDTYLHLSSGIARYFIQLCFYAFDFAYKENSFIFGRDAQLSIDAQDRAAYHLSVNKVDELDTYPPVGHKLKRLTLVLGRIFEQLHKRPGIHEPEPNHFYTNYDGLSASTKEVLDSGIMWAVFQPRPLTKIKSRQQPRGFEYHLNHIYAPYFEISYRRKRRLDISTQYFDRLVNANDEIVASVANKLVGGRKSKFGTLADLLQWEDMQAYQTDLWDLYESQQNI